MNPAGIIEGSKQAWKPQTVYLVITRARLIGVKEQCGLVMTHVILVAAGILVLLRAQYSTHVVTLKELWVGRRRLRERTAQQQQSGTKHTSPRPCIDLHKGASLGNVEVVGIP
jgi:hypothetical protein